MGTDLLQQLLDAGLITAEQLREETRKREQRQEKKQKKHWRSESGVARVKTNPR